MTDSTNTSPMLSAAPSSNWFDLNTAAPQSLLSVKPEDQIKTEDLNV